VFFIPENGYEIRASVNPRGSYDKNFELLVISNENLGSVSHSLRPNSVTNFCIKAEIIINLDRNHGKNLIGTIGCKDINLTFLQLCFVLLGVLQRWRSDEHNSMKS
jgi:hypothetical protein